MRSPLIDGRTASVPTQFHEAQPTQLSTVTGRDDHATRRCPRHHRLRAGWSYTRHRFQ